MCHKRTNFTFSLSLFHGNQCFNKYKYSIKKPIGNGILTCNNKKQAVKRANPKKKDKGGEAVNAVISVFNVIK